MRIKNPIAEDAKEWYSVHRQWWSPYSVVLCGNLTIPNYRSIFHCFLLILGNINCATALAGHRAAILFNLELLGKVIYIVRKKYQELCCN